MNPVLVIRADILSTLIVAFLIVYDRYCAKFREGDNYFLGVALACLGHDITALITEITVNSDTVPKTVNDVAHILFFMCSVLFSVLYFHYAMSLVFRKKTLRIYRIASDILFLILSIVLIVSPIEYLQGDGTRYSAGIGPTICYMTGFVLFMCADILIAVYRKRISDAIVYSILPISTMALAFLIVQIVIPEFLFTGGALTLMTIGLFCATENPIAKLERKVFFDEVTQVWNRNCYETDLQRIFRPKAEKGTDIIYVLGDINGLKLVNDNLGHQMGDQLLVETAQVLEEYMKDAYRVYRIGGDEFAALFLDKNLENVRAAMAQVKAKCDSFQYGEGLPVGISLGVARKEKTEDLSETIQRADREMYEAKNAYYRNHKIERRRIM